MQDFVVNTCLRVYYSLKLQTKEAINFNLHNAKERVRNYVLASVILSRF